jgi:hypothetical protein
VSERGEAEDATPIPRPLKIACVLVGLESLALLAAAGFIVVSTITGTPDSVGRALLDAAFALLGALVLALCLRGLLRLSPVARTPVILLQLLAVVVSYSLAFQAGRVGYGGPIFVAALATLYLLFTPPVRAVLDREPPR